MEDWKVRRASLRENSEKLEDLRRDALGLEASLEFEPERRFKARCRYWELSSTVGALRIGVMVGDDGFIAASRASSVMVATTLDLRLGWIAVESLATVSTARNKVD